MKAVMKSEFVGAGIRPPGVFHMEHDGVYVEMNTCVFISTLHKLMRRDETEHLNCVMKGAFIALLKREFTSGIKSVWTQYRNRVFITLVEEGVLLFVTPEKGNRIVDLVIQMFQVELELPKRLDMIDEFCNLIDGCYRGRVPSFMNSWFMTNPETLDKLGINRPPVIELMSEGNVSSMLKCKLSTKSGKMEFKSIIQNMGTRCDWIYRIIPEVSHLEFNKLLYYSAVASLEYTIDVDMTSEYAGSMKTPTLDHLKEIGVFDCHSGKGDFNDFLDKGVLVKNKAPITLYGFNGDETENMYIMVKKEIGSQRWIKKQKLKEDKIEKKNNEKRIKMDKKVYNDVNKIMNKIIEKLEKDEEKKRKIESKLENNKRMKMSENKKVNKKVEKGIEIQIQNPVIAQLPTGKHKPMVVYNVNDGKIDGSGYKQFKLRKQYLKCKQHEDLLKMAGSPAMPSGVTWDDETQTMHFQPIEGTLVTDETQAIDNVSFDRPVRVLPRSELGVKMFREVDDRDIVEMNMGRFVKHCIIAALLDIGDQSPNNFILTGDVIYAVDNADKRTKFNMNETDFVTLLTNKPMKKGSLLRVECEKYVERNSEMLKKYIRNVNGGVLETGCNGQYDWNARKDFMIGLL